jgi:heme/copper-type cytochrome/quinol oxidase subunit 2
MSGLAHVGVIAHAGSADTSETGQLVMTIGLVSVLVFIWILLGVVCWIFWRAKKREDAANEGGPGWQSAPSS